MSNLHITLTNFLHESRVLKECKTILKHPKVEKIYIAALFSKGLNETSVKEGKIFIKRFKLLLRIFPNVFVFQLIKYVEFFFRIIVFYKDKNISIINIHSLALLPIGVLLKIFLKSKLIYDAHELETERCGLKGLRRRIDKLVELITIRYCDAIFVVSGEIAKDYKKRYSNIIPEPVVVYNTPKYFVAKKNNLLRLDLGIARYKKIFLYQGALSVGRGIELILETFLDVSLSDVVVVFMGYGELENKIKKYASIHENIFFKEAVSVEELLLYTSSADFGLCLIENKSLSYYYCMPNKLFEYIMSDLPIIVSPMLEMKSFVQKHKIGVVLENTDKNSLLKVIKDLSNGKIVIHKENLLKVKKTHSWEQEECKILNLFDKILGTK